MGERPRRLADREATGSVRSDSVPTWAGASSGSSGGSARERRVGLRLALPGLLVAALTGCPGPSPTTTDGGRERDASLLDATLTVDDAAVDGAAVEDAALTDTGALLACGGACDPRATTPCDSTEHCLLDDGGPTCVATAGVLRAGEACEGAGDCGPGLACFAEPGSPSGVCAQVCCPGDDTCGPDLRCGGAGVLVGGAMTYWGRCSPVRPCDVLHPEFVCAARESCYIVDAEGRTECLVAGTAGDGEPCTRASDCAPGGVCAGLTVMTCARVCPLDVARGCEMDRRCEAQAYSPPGTGICAPLP